jgi:serine/threonine protein kinase
MLSLREYGLDWSINPSDETSVVPSDFLNRISTIEITKSAGRDLYTIAKPNGDVAVYVKGTYLGEGTFGVVSEAFQAGRGGVKNCVVKAIKDSGEEALKQMILETLIQIIVCKETATSNYPEYNLIGPFAPAVFDIAYDPNTKMCYIFSEKMRKTIQNLLKDFATKPLKEQNRDIVYVLIRICVILIEVYKKLKLNHRDFKSDNCMYIRDAAGNLMPRLIDFGFSSITYKGLVIDAKKGYFKHRGLESRDMSQLIYEIFYYDKWIPKDLQEVAKAILTEKRGGKVCKVLDGNCDVESWRNTYDFYNTKMYQNPNANPEAVLRILKTFISGGDWKAQLSSWKKARPVKQPAVVHGELGPADDVWENPSNIPCPAVKPDYNPKTKRCVKKCPDGKYRNKEFKCVTLKAKVIAKANVTVKRASAKKCPAGKERNPKTGRCVKLCPGGFKRDANFRCVRTAVAAIAAGCGPGKQLNPKTNRCVNLCKPGFMRDESFKCVKATGSRKFALAAAVAGCPPTKPDYNPNTKRCVKACAAGFMRDEKFICVKATESRKRAVAAKLHGCPHAKPDFNPKTRRCVKACPAGKKRNSDTFKCI